MLRSLIVGHSIIDRIQHERSRVTFGIDAGNTFCIHCSTQRGDWSPITGLTAWIYDGVNPSNTCMVGVYT